MLVTLVKFNVFKKPTLCVRTIKLLHKYHTPSCMNVNSNRITTTTRHGTTRHALWLNDCRSECCEFKSGCTFEFNIFPKHLHLYFRFCKNAIFQNYGNIIFFCRFVFFLQPTFLGRLSTDLHQIWQKRVFLHAI